MIKKIDHIGIAVHSLEQSPYHFIQIFLMLTLQRIEEVESESVKVAFIHVGDTKLELLEPPFTESPIAKYIEKHGKEFTISHYVSAPLRIGLEITGKRN